MTPRCDRCEHARSNHGRWWVDRGTTPCHVRGCLCDEYADYCSDQHDLYVMPDGSVRCTRCPWELQALPDAPSTEQYSYFP